MGGDLEAFPNYEYTKMEYSSTRKPRSRSPSPTRTAVFRFRRIRYLLLRICLLITAFIFMFTSVDRICNTTLLAQGNLTYVLPMDALRASSSPLQHTQQFRPWGFQSQTSAGDQDGIVFVPSEAVLKKQEDDTGVRRIHNIIHNKVVNNSVIFVPVKSADMIWVDNLHCRINGHLKLRNIIYWAMEESAAIALQERGYKFFYCPLLEARRDETRRVEEGMNTVRLWGWISRAGVNLLWMEPRVALFKTPFEGLRMDADIEGIFPGESMQEVRAEGGVSQLGTGVMWMKAGPDVGILLSKVYSALMGGKYNTEAEALNSLLRANPSRYLSLDNPSLPPSHDSNSTTEHRPSTAVLSYRTMSPFTHLTYSIFEKDIHLHTLGYSSAFSLRDSNWDVDRFFPTMLYVHHRDLEKFERRKRDTGAGGQGRMVERWKSLGWWELNDDGKCALLASRPKKE